MPKTVKLSSADARAWRENRPQWVSPQGIVLRGVTPEEEKAIFPSVELAKKMKRSGKHSVEAEYRVRGADGTVRPVKVPMLVVLRVTRTGRSDDSFLVDVFVGGNRYVRGREVLRKRILEKHGEVILQNTNGKQICVIRDPRLNRPSFAESQRVAPSPERCHCRGFKDNPEPHRHHSACEWNAKAPIHERALPFERVPVRGSLLDSPNALSSLAFESPSQYDPTAQQGYQDPSAARAALTPAPMLVPGQLGARVLEGPQRQVVYSQAPLPPGGMPAGGMLPAPASVMTPTVAHTPRRTVAQQTAPVSPQDCTKDCRGLRGGPAWPWPPQRTVEDNAHHPLCPDYEHWSRKVTGARQWMLYDLNRRLEVRPATAHELAEAEINEKRLGVRSVQVGDSLYAIVQAGSQPHAPAPQSMRGQRIASLATPAPQESLRSNPDARVTSAPTAPRTRSVDQMSVSELEALLAQRRSASVDLPGVPEPAGEEPPQGLSLGYGELTADDEAAMDGVEPSPIEEPYEEETFAGDLRDSLQEDDLLEDPYSGMEVHEVRMVRREQPASRAQQPPALVPGHREDLYEDFGELPPMSPTSQAQEQSDVQAYRSTEDPNLRNELGLVGLQQKTSDIDPGPVMIIDPEPFVDPLKTVKRGSGVGVPTPSPRTALGAPGRPEADQTQSSSPHASSGVLSEGSVPLPPAPTVPVAEAS